MFDPLAFVAVAGVAASGTAAVLVLAAAIATALYRPGNGRRRRIRN
jgi:hypothetical protein